MNKKYLKKIIIFLLFSFFVLSGKKAIAKNPLLKNLNSPTLIETKELANLINHPQVRIIDLRSSLSDYLRGHIPNAIYLHCENIMIPEKGIPVQAPDRIYLERLLGENLCISNNMFVILYSEKSNINAALLAWSLDLLGHKKFALLNGGWEKWKIENLPTTQQYPLASAKKFFGKIIQEKLAEKQYILNRLKSDNLVIIDSRSPKMYIGEEGAEIRKGHIPRAINIFWENTIEGNEVKVWKKKEDLERNFYGHGVTKDKEIIVYCQTGKEASHLFFTLKHIFHFPNVRLYRGGWVEWSSDINLPIKTGNEP